MHDPEPPAHAPTSHMSPDQFREHGHQTIDWIAAYWSRLQSGTNHAPVLSAAKPGDIAAMLPASAPEHAEPWHTIWPDIDRVIMPGITHWQDPRFFAYFPANASGPAVLGDLLAAGLGVNGMLWATSPAATELEARVLDWLAQLCGLPAEFLSTSANGGGVIQSTASDAVVVAMCAARHRARAQGADLRASRAVVYTSTQAHSSIVKGAMVTGIADGPDDRIGVRLIDIDDQHRLRPDLLAAVIRENRAAGRTPIMISATVGTTSSMAIDDVQALGEIAHRERLWLHVDAAMAGAAWICPEHRDLLRGCEYADTIGFNPHKWLLTNFDCHAMWTRDRASLTGALSITPEYLRNAATAAGSVTDYREWQVPLGRRFRALKLWLVIRHYGADGLRNYIREHVRLGALLESLVRADSRFESLPRGGQMPLICFRLRGSGEAAEHRNRALLRAINESGHAHLTHTVIPWPGREALYTLRMCIGSTFTREQHVRDTWTLIAKLASEQP